ncbi:MAG: hypothetical protein SFV15_24090 [Polyangiaceae bacterium]|nr:hypothetical protein [Polyangiaceae bacterium]
MNARSFFRYAEGLSLGALMCACGEGAGRYGHARSYVPYADEAELTYLEFRLAGARNDPASFFRNRARIFGTVVRRVSAPGAVTLVLRQRELAPGNTCISKNKDAWMQEDKPPESTCRVTVTDERLPLIRAVFGEGAGAAPELLPGDLVMLVGLIDYMDGEPVIAASAYRAWPKGEFIMWESTALSRLARFD